MGCGCDQTGDGPSAFVQLTYRGCTRNGVRGMIALIRAGDRHTDKDIVQHRCVCRGCEELRMDGKRPVCGRDMMALHWLTALGSHRCDKWAR